MFLKNEKYLLILFASIFFFIHSGKAYSNIDNKIKISQYLNSLKFFSASFIQNDGENLSEGVFYIGEKRVRAEYSTPTKILIILDRDKAMYYDYELEEDEFFDPKRTNAWFLYDLFRNPYFFDDALIKIKNNELILEKTGLDDEQNQFLIKIFFENNPLVLRKVEFLVNDNFLQLSIFNHSYNQEFDKKFFKLISPNLSN
tara:strand:+ start:312 stop:911 length:600 start_codon:yes stop_codon:yes gene_type:complete